ncbi:hypothetical protein INR49_012106 [Caranx melampygus]|nr:hypothetical protein INR49_012106 [Caranx melampygus]
MTGEGYAAGLEDDITHLALRPQALEAGEKSGSVGGTVEAGVAIHSKKKEQRRGGEGTERRACDTMIGRLTTANPVTPPPFTRPSLALNHSQSQSLPPLFVISQEPLTAERLQDAEERARESQVAAFSQAPSDRFTAGPGSFTAPGNAFFSSGVWAAALSWSGVIFYFLLPLLLFHRSTLAQLSTRWRQRCSLFGRYCL